MVSTTSIKQVSRDKARAELRELVIAWATDADTHLATYILELGPERSGAKSRCLCPGCGGPLVAVNNAKTQYKVRPHFRHHQGSNSKDCAIVAARMAILRTMTDLGWIDLPARARSTSIKGLDGRDYEGMASRPPERVRVIRAEFSDCAPAVLHLEDGRQITVLLRGEAAPTDGSPHTGAVVVIEVDDPAVALMDPQQLRERLSLNAGACWHQHWDDAAILDEATSQARETAIDHLALAPDGLDLPSDMPAELKSETVLHYVVKHILKEAGELRTPEDVVYVEAESEKRCHSRTWRLPEQHLALSEVELEKRLGLTRPDLVCKAIDTAGDYSYPSLCIEVTVSNTISQERRNRIREVGLPALEIDLSALQGRITLGRLKHLVVTSTYVKKWIYNPVVTQKFLELEKEVKALAAAEDEALEEERAEMRRVNALPLQEVAEQYLEKAYRYFLLLQDTGDSWPAAGSTTAVVIAEAREDLSKQANLLAWKSYPGADEEDFLHPRGVLESLLSLKFDRGLTRKLNTGFQVLNALVTGGKGIANELTPLYLAAAKAFDVPMTLAQQAIVEQWRGEVIERIRTIKGSYVRSSVYDPLLGALFPELREALPRTTGTHFLSVYQKHQQKLQPPPRELQPREATRATMAATLAEFRHTMPSWMRSSGFLSGADLESWIEQNPESANSWGVRSIKEKKGS